MNVKFMQSLDQGVYAELKRIAKERGITVQEFLRAVVVVDWLRSYDGREREATPRARAKRD